MKRRRTFLVSSLLLAGCGSPQTTAAPPTPTTRPATPAGPVPTDDPIGFASVAPGTIGGRGGQLVEATTADDLRRYVISRDPLIVQISGALALSGMTPVGSNKTILGIGTDARIANGGFNLSAVNNVVIRNLTFSNSPDDAINLENGSHHVWIDHNTIGQATDGGLDIKRESSYVTVSWNVFAQQSKTSLVGHDDNFPADRGKLKVTYHHNWFKSDQRNPRVRFGEVHVFNNYYDAVRSYGIASTQDAKVVVEGNVFRSVRQPMLVGYEESGPGDLVERNNLYESSGAPQTRGEAFDPTAYYAFSLTPLSEVPGLVQAAAGAGKLRDA